MSLLIFVQIKGEWRRKRVDELTLIKPEVFKINQINSIAQKNNVDCRFYHVIHVGAANARARTRAHVGDTRARARP